MLTGICEASLMDEPINVRFTFMTMLVIRDLWGDVIGTDVAIARRLNMPLAEFQQCVAVLLSREENSVDGPRLERASRGRGYRVVTE